MLAKFREILKNNWHKPDGQNFKLEINVFYKFRVNSSLFYHIYIGE